MTSELAIGSILYLDGVKYGPDGLCHGHTWRWPRLVPSYVYPRDVRAPE